MAEQAHRQCLSLPIFPGMVEGQVSAVVKSVLRFFGA